MVVKTTKYRKPRVGTVIKVIQAETGALGANEEEAIVVDYSKIKNKDITGLTKSSYSNSIFIKILKSNYGCEGKYWAIGEKVTCDKCKSQNIDHKPD